MHSSSTVSGGAGSLLDGSGGGTAAGNYNHGAYVARVLGSITPAMVTGSAGSGDKSEDTEGDFFNFLPAALLAAGADARRSKKKRNGRVLEALFARLRRLGTFESAMERGGILVLRSLDGHLTANFADAGSPAACALWKTEIESAQGSRRVLVLEGEDSGPLTGFAATVTADGRLLSSSPLAETGHPTTAELVSALTLETAWERRLAHPSDLGTASRDLHNAFGLV